MRVANASERFAELIELDQVMLALAHPVRRFLLELIIIDGAYAGNLAASAATKFGISTQRGSQHLKVLENAGIVEVTVDGTWRHYRLEPGSTESVSRWISSLWI
ncbi:ArsR/SmtB family transcription factor [Demequina oxidasica]|uniref:ArsR/SmtB family transcription factor n=1 Tax=Demequina oxidasica TaxID=676199 RepID=UPI000785E842|nr:metalloregulator ArsR/SmtB family transcription factor [Demequina oxidasica]